MSRRPAHAAAGPGRRRSLLLVLVLWLGLAGAAPAAEQVAVQLSWHHQFQFAGYYVALARGYYREAGLDVELRPAGPGSPDAVEAVAGGRAEYGVGNSGVAVAHMRGQPVVVLAAVLQDSAMVWLARDRDGRPPTREELAQLAAGRVVLGHRPYEVAELMLPLRAAGVDLEALPTQWPAYPLQLFREGRIDLLAGYRSSEAVLLREQGVAFTFVQPEPEAPHFYGELLFTSRSHAEAHPRQVERMRAATLRGWQEAFDDIEGTARLIHERYPTERSLAQLVAEGRELERLSRREDVELGHVSAGRWRRIAEVQRIFGLAPPAADVEQLIWQPAAEGASLWPDPMRLVLTGLVAALWLTVWGLWRQAVRAREEVGQLRQARDAAVDDDLRFQFLMDVAPFPVLMFGFRDGEVVYANERAIGALELGDGAALPIHECLPALHPRGELMQRLQAARILRDVELERPGRGTEASHWSLLTMRAIEYDGKPCAFVAAVDITLRKRAELDLAMLSAQRGRIIEEIEQLQTKLRDASLRDPLTGLFNRRYLDTTLKRELLRCQRDGSALTVMVIDADHFKRVNDTHGHAGGDEVLRQIARVLQQGMRGEDVVCRYGGEEFVVVLPGSDATQVLARAESLRAQVAALEIPTDSGFVRITVSIGLAGRCAGDDPERLFKRADAAVYAAKHGGRNRVVVADPPPTHEPDAAPAVVQS